MPAVPAPGTVGKIEAFRRTYNWRGELARPEARKMAAAGSVEVLGQSFPIYGGEAKSILSRTSGFIARAGFTHSLTPARNCVYGCSYCYVPTLGIYGGLKPDDWKFWGRHTTYKTNSADLLRKQLRPDQVIYCSPLVDPYQPAERVAGLMPAILERLCENPPKSVVIQTRGATVLRDADALMALARRTRLRISFSLTTNRDEVRRIYEPRCGSVDQRVRVMEELTSAGLRVHCTLAPILPCDPERLAELALQSTACSVIADPLHSREGKPHGATTRPEGLRVSGARRWDQWHRPPFQAQVIERIRERVEAAGRSFGIGEAGFRMLISDP